MLIISGGQTGADRGGLEAAIALGISHSGYCPKGRKAEDGVIPPKYRLKETGSDDYRERTSRNVALGDATIVFTYGQPKSGSALTIKLANRARKPYVHIDLTDEAESNVDTIMRFVKTHISPTTPALNVAGSRASSAPEIEKVVKDLLYRALHGHEYVIKPPIEKKKLPLFDARAHGAKCDECPLNGYTVVPPAPASIAEPEAIFVGEAPGYNEERTGKPFVGASGTAFDRILKKNDLKRRNMHVTNGLLCRPHKEEDFKQAIACCKPRLDRELAQFPKAPIIPMGGKAMWSLVGKKQKILFSRGFVWDIEGREVFPTVHPAFVARDPLWYPAYARDMRRIAKRIHEGSIDLERATYTVPRNLHEVKAQLATLRKVVSCDVETDRWIYKEVDGVEVKIKVTATTAPLQCVGFSDGKNSVVVPWNPKYRRAIHRFIKSRKTIIGHNIFAFDSIVLEKHGMPIPIEKIEDTILAHHAFAGHMPARLDHLVSMYLTTYPWKMMHGMRGGGDEKGIAKTQLDPEELYLYNADDCHFTFHVWKRLQADLESAASVYVGDKRTAVICRDMQINGVLVDQVQKMALATALRAKERRIYKELRQMARDVGVKNFKPTKPAKIRQMLYKAFELTPWEFTPKGLPSTNKVVLQAVAQRPDTIEGKFAKLVLTWRKANKIRSTYLDGLNLEDDGCVHPSWRAFGTITARLAARQPNLQNLARYRASSPDPEDKIRSIYIARPTNKLVGFDLSAVEARLCGYLSGDANLIRACESGDIHTANAKMIFGDLPELQDPKEAKSGKGAPLRDLAKNCIYGLAYAAGAETIFEFVKAQGRKTTMVQVQTMLAKMKREYAQYYTFVEANMVFAKEHGYVVERLSGRRRWVGHYPELATVSNFPIQAAAATVMNAMLDRICQRLPPGVLVIGQVHDSAYFDTPIHLVETMRQIIIEETAKPFEINGRTVIFKIDLKDGASWAEAA